MIKIKKKRLQTGLDIGSSSIKFIQLSGTLDNLLLVNFDVIKVGEELEDQKKVLQNIARSSSVKEVNISISGPAIVIRYVELPKMTDEELKSSMKFEAEKYIPFDIKEVILDCQILEYIGQGKMRVLLAAAKKEAITYRLNLVESAGLVAKIIDCDSFALANTFLLNFSDLDENNNIALINLGDRLTTIDILKGKTPYFTRELQIGGWNFAKAISEGLNLDIRAASGLVENPQPRYEELIKIVRPIITHIIEEIKLSLNYYENQTGVVVDRICLSGGLSNFKGLEDIFNESLGVECRLWNPLKRLTIDKDLAQDKLNMVKNQLAIAVGLAIRGLR